MIHEFTKEDIRYFEDEAYELAVKLRSECDGDNIGAGEEVAIEKDSVLYALSVTAFWEKSFWFEYAVVGQYSEYTDAVYL